MTKQSQNKNKPKLTSRKTKRTKRYLKPRTGVTNDLSDDFNKWDTDDYSDSKSAKPSFQTIRNSINEKSQKRFFKEIIDQDQRRGVHIPQYVLMITNSAADALVFSQIIYWLSSEKRGNLPRPEKGLLYKWTAQTSKELGKQLFRTEDEIDKSLQRLKKKGVIEWKIKIFSGKRHRHIWLVWSKIEEAYKNKKMTDDDSDE